MKTTTHPNPTELHATIKLGIDAHAKWFYVARQLDGATPQPVQKMTFDALLRRVQRHIQFRLPDAPMRRELFALDLPNPERVKANLRSLAEQSRGLTGGDILNICLNAIHAGSRDPDPAKWMVTEEMLLRELKRARAAKEKHCGKSGSRRRIGFTA
jgi:AAA+ superfamily predicted ATPase